MLKPHRHIHIHMSGKIKTLLQPKQHASCLLDVQPDTNGGDRECKQPGTGIAGKYY